MSDLKCYIHKECLKDPKIASYILKHKKDIYLEEWSPHRILNLLNNEILIPYPLVLVILLENYLLYAQIGVDNIPTIAGKFPINDQEDINSYAAMIEAHFIAIDEGFDKDDLDIHIGAKLFSDGVYLNFHGEIDNDWK